MLAWHWLLGFGPQEKIQGMVAMNGLDNGGCGGEAPAGPTQEDEAAKAAAADAAFEAMVAANPGATVIGGPSVSGPLSPLKR